MRSLNEFASASGAESRPRGVCALGDGARGPQPRAHVTRPPRTYISGRAVAPRTRVSEDRGGGQQVSAPRAPPSFRKVLGLGTVTALHQENLRVLAPRVPPKTHASVKHY